MTKAKQKPKTEKTNDPMLIGYQFAYENDKTPYDFVSDADGYRPGNTTKPFGNIDVNCENGIDGLNIPPLKIWKEGEWEQEARKGRRRFNAWIVSGEGTPGNYETRTYVVPSKIAEMNDPSHPMMWTKEQKEKKGWSAWRNSATSSSQSLPLGIRFRCPDCGHWFKESDVAGHAQCCPTKQQYTHWAIACECCDSLDMTATVKPGFPIKDKPGAEPDKPEDTVETETKETVEAGV